METGIGVVVSAGRSYDITRLELRGGQLVITATRRGPIPAIVREPMTVFGVDGQGFMQGGELSHEKVRRRGTAEITVTFQVVYAGILV